MEQLKAKILHFLQRGGGRGSSPAVLALGWALALAVFTLSHLSGQGLRPELFYLIPVALVSLRCGPTQGYLLCLACGAFTALPGLAMGDAPYLAVVNTMLAAGLYAAFSALLRRLTGLLAQADRSATQDPLTGLHNRKALGQALSREIERCRRFKRPFALAHLSCDNLEAVGDRLGRPATEGVLRLIAECASATLRTTDAVARIYDHEFAVLLTESPGQAALLAVEKLKSRLAEIITRHYPELSFSIGLVNFSACPYTADEVLDMADLAMNEARLGGRMVVHSRGEQA